MVKQKMSKQKGYVLLVTIAITLVMSLVAVGLITIIYRYQATILSQLAELRETVLN